MKKINWITATTLLLIVAFIHPGCSTQQDSPNEANAVDAHNAQNALDWAGIYEGVVPCASCPGILTRLELKQDSQYLLTTFYLDEDGQTFYENGKFTWDAGGSVITLTGEAEGASPTKYRVEEGQLRQLDIEGNEITNGMAEFYSLKKKVPAEIENKRWSLVKFKGKPVPLDSAGYFLIFQSAEGNISTKVGCNQMGFGYFLLPEQKLQITLGRSTKMACPGNTIETEYAQTLPAVDNYSLSKEGKLSLQKGKEVVAVFQ